jgi:hypothetical protein
MLSGQNKKNKLLPHRLTSSWYSNISALIGEFIIFYFSFSEDERHTYVYNIEREKKIRRESKIKITPGEKLERKKRKRMLV